MSMLAEPRRHRKRYNLVPRGKALFEDDERFGTKMLQKMGWSKGKGLGANETGNEEFVRLQYKNDTHGLGFEERDDQWTQHEESFSGLLSSLNGSTGGDGGASKGVSDDEGAFVGLGFSVGSTEQNKKIAQQREKFSGESLEEKSKQSRARVHYKKFTKSKDLTQYSEKDLANIFGKKAVDEKVKVPLSYDIPEEQVAAQIHGNNDMEEDNFMTKKEKRKAESVIISKLSVSDYFKQKKEAMLNKKKETQRKASVAEDNEAVLYPEEQEDTKSALKRKPTELETCDNKVSEDAPLEKKHIKNKRVKVDSDEHIEREISAEILEKDSVHTARKHKSKSKRAERSDSPKSLIKNEDTDQPKIKKKRKNKEEEEFLNTTEISLDYQETPRSNKKMKPTSKTVEAPILDEANGNTKEDSEISNCEMKDMMKKGNRIIEHDDMLLDIKNDNLKGNVLEVSTPVGAIDENRKEREESIAEVGTSALGEILEGHDASALNSNPKPLITVGKELLSVDELVARHSSLHVYTISSFCAEKFRNTDLNQFLGSNMAQIGGYSLKEDIKLNIETRPKDEDNINEMWWKALNKYKDAAPKKSYYTYVKQINMARKEKKKLPRLSVKKWKRQKVFKAI